MLAYLFVVIARRREISAHPFAFTPVGASLLFFGAAVAPTYGCPGLC